MKEFESAGWSLDRTKGSHFIYVKNGHHFSVPGPASRESKNGLVAAARKKIKEVG